MIGGSFPFTYHTLLCPLIYDLNKKLKYCAPNHPKRQYQQKKEQRYQNPVKNLIREDDSKCAPELYPLTNYIYHVCKISIIL